MGMFPPSRETGLCWRVPGPYGAVPLLHHHSAKLYPEAPAGAQGTRDQAPCFWADEYPTTFQAVLYSSIKIVSLLMI